MSKRLSPAERLRTQIDEVFAGGQDLSRAIEQVAQLGAQLLLQCALEAQVTMMLGRGRYERAASCQDACAGMRNGYCATTIKTTAGPVTLQRPKVRGTTERVADRLCGKGVTKTNALESLVIAGFVRGLSVRDVEAALAEALGPQATVSKSTVSRICTQIKTQFEAFSQRRLDDVELDYLFLDGSHFKYHVGAAAEPVLAAWGIDTDDKPVFVGLGRWCFSRGVNPVIGYCRRELLGEFGFDAEAGGSVAHDGELLPGPGRAGFDLRRAAPGVLQLVPG